MTATNADTEFFSRPRIIWATVGANTHDCRFITALIELGWSVVLLPFGGIPPTLPPGLDSNSYLRAPDWLGWHEDATVWTPRCVNAINEIELRFQPSIIHAGPLTTVAHAVSESTQTPVVAMSWGFDLLRDVENDEQAASKARETINRVAAVHVDCRAGTNAAVRLGARPNQVHCIPWGVDLNQFHPPRTRTTHSRVNVLSARSLEPLYDVKTTIAGFAIAVSELPTCPLTLTVLGDGLLRAELHEYAQKLGVSDSVNWIGRVSEQDLSELMRSAEIYVASSLIDGSSITLLQAMASGLPSIVPAVGGNIEWVTPGVTGHLFEAQDARALGKAILSVVESPESAKSMGIAARTAVQERGDWVQNRAKLNLMYASIENALPHREHSGGITE